VTFLYALSVLTIIQGVYTLVEAWRAAAYMRRGVHLPPNPGGPRIAVFCPCKGLDHDFEKNVRSVLLQDYADFIVYFIVESQADPAFAILKSVGAQNVLIAGEAVECGQKVHNLRFAVERADATAQIFVFCDSDARYPRNWLSRLTAPLADRDAGVSTGYRWYVASRFHLPTLLRSAWNSTALSLLGDHNHNFAWGGSLAIRRPTFDSIGVMDAWRGAVSDDYAITRAAESAGVRIHFTPTCLIPSYGDCRFRELLEFTTRQIIITRVYREQLWRLGLLAQTIFNLTFVGLPAAALAGGGSAFVVLWLIVYGLSAARSALRLSAVREVLHDPSLWRFAWFYILSPPVVSLIYEYNMLRSAATTHIEWRNIHYNLISPNETRVRRSSAGAS
jgi:ceramide glucosyltransferase